MATQLDELIVKISGDVAELKTAMVEASKVTQQNASKMDAALDDFSKNSDKSFNTASIAFGSFIGSLASTATTAAFAGLKNALSAGINSARDFSSAVAEVNSILPETAKLTKINELALVKLSSQYGGTPQKQAKAFYQIVSSGVTDTAEATELLTIANKAAVAGVTDVETAIRGLTNATASYGDQGLTAQEAADALFTTVRLGKTDFGLLANNIGKVAPIAKAAGVSFNELAGTIAFVTQTGLSTEEVMTGLKATIQAVAAPTDELKKTAAGMGVSLGEASLKSIGLEGIMRQIATATGGSLAEIKKFIPSVEAAGVVAAITSGKFSNFSDVLREMDNASGATQKAFEQLEMSADFQLTALEQEIANIIPTMINLADKPIAELVKSFRESLPDSVLLAADALRGMVDAGAFAVDAIAVISASVEESSARWSAWGNVIKNFVSGDFTAAGKAFEEGEAAIKAIDERLTETIANNQLAKFSKQLGATRDALAEAFSETGQKTISSTSQVLQNSMQQNAVKTKEATDEITKFADKLKESLPADTITAESELIQAQYDAQILTLEAFIEQRRELLNMQQEEELSKLNEAFEAGKLSEQEFWQARGNIVKSGISEQIGFEKQLTDAKKKEEQARQANFRSSLNTIASLADSGNSTLATIGKAAAITTATIDGIVAVQKALASAPPPFNFALAGLVGAATAANVAKIAGVQLQSGIDEVPGPFNQDRFPAVLAGGERVVPAETNQDLKRFLQNANQGGAGNVTLNVTIVSQGVAIGDEGKRQLIEAVNEGIEEGIGRLRTVSA